MCTCSRCIECHSCHCPNRALLPANLVCSYTHLTAGKPPVLSVNPHVPALLAYAQQAAQQVSGAGSAWLF